MLWAEGVECLSVHVSSPPVKGCSQRLNQSNVSAALVPVSITKSSREPEPHSAPTPHPSLAPYSETHHQARNPTTPPARNNFSLLPHFKELCLQPICHSASHDIMLTLHFYAL